MGTVGVGDSGRTRDKQGQPDGYHSYKSWTCIMSADGHRLKSRSRWSRLVPSVFAPWSKFEAFSRRIRPRASRDVLVKSVGSACRLVMREKELSLWQSFPL